MRPINKTNTFTPNPLTAVSNATALKVFTANVPKVKPVGKTKTRFNTPDVFAFMKQMTELNNGSATWGKLTADQRTTIKYLYETVFTDNANTYKRAKLPLVNALGQFCSYCGMRINDSSMAVEHCLPKSEFPAEMLMYDNFLLACGSCNSSNKGAKPTYKEGIKWSKKAKPTYLEVKAAALNNFWWAFDKNLAVYNTFNMQLFNTANNPFTMTDATNAANVITAVNDGKVDATVNGTAYKNVTGQVTGTDAKAKATIDIVGMNKPADANLADRRMLNRTQTWFESVQSYQLNNLVAQLPDSPQKKALMKATFDSTLSTAANSGFYSVWVTVFVFLSPPLDFNNLFRQFKNATSGANIYFPGTDSTYLPF